MSKIIIGIDPDSKAHGVAIYIDGKLNKLHSLPLVKLMDCMVEVGEKYDINEDMEVHIENVCAMNAVFKQRQKGRGGVDMAMARRLGMCQQSQVELERVFERMKVKVVKHKISKMWKKDKAQFEKVTGWTGRSNEDTRSAAYFGWLGVKS